MSAWYMLMDPRFSLYTSNSVMTRTAGGTLGNLAGRPARVAGKRSIVQRFSDYLARRALSRELAQLDDRMLADIGLSRAFIPSVVGQLNGHWQLRRAARDTQATLRA